MYFLHYFSAILRNKMHYIDVFRAILCRSVKKEIILNILLDQMHLTELKRADKII